MPGRITGKRSDKIKKRKKKKIRLETGRIKLGLKKDEGQKYQGQKTIPRRKRKRRPGEKWSIKDLDLKNSISMEKVKKLIMQILEACLVLLFAFVFVWYFGQRVSTVGSSMEPVLENGDVVFVNRFVYNTSSPKRGDVIVFKPKGNENSHYYIKRIIGLPGETVQIVDGYTYINGQLLESDIYGAEVMESGGIAQEQIVLGENEYFVLGDNRNHSSDSRDPSVGVLTRDNLLGRAWVRIYPFDNVGVIRHE